MFKKKKTYSDEEEKLDNKITEEIQLKCNCGNVVVKEDTDVFMMGFEAEESLEEYQKEFSIVCDYCDKKIGYDELNNKSKEIFNENIIFFIEEINY